MLNFSLSQLDAVIWLDAQKRPLDLIITDPPYASLEKHRAIGTTTRLTKKWFPVVPNTYFEGFFRAAYRALAKNAHLYVFTDAESMFVMKPYAEAAGFKFWKPIVWDKVSIGMGYHYRARYEFILFFEKGYRKLNSLSIPDVLTAKRIRDKTAYPTEKPESLILTIVKQSAKLGDLVGDPFMGSGVVGSAAALMGCDFAGNDILLDAVEYARKRLEII